MLALVLLSVIAADARAPASAAPAPEVTSKIVHREKSAYADVLIIDEGPLRYMRFDSIYGDDQSVIDLRDPAAVPMEYVRVASAALALIDQKRETRALVIGVGGATFPMVLRRYSPLITIDAVDINPVVIDLARRFFAVKEDARLRLIVDDGARFIRQNVDTKYDLILLDAYEPDGIPEALSTPNFFAAVRERVTPSGVVLANIAVEREGDERPLVRRLAIAFDSCLVLRGKDRRNSVVLLSRAPLPTESDLRARFRVITKQRALPFDLDAAVVDVAACLRAR